MGFKDTKWTKTAVNSHLRDAAESWLDHAKVLESIQMVSPYTIELAHYIALHPSDRVIYPTVVVEYVDGKALPVDDLVAVHKARKRQRLGPVQGRCNASHKRLVLGSLKNAAEKSRGFLTATWKTKKRLLCYEVHYDH